MSPGAVLAVNSPSSRNMNPSVQMPTICFIFCLRIPLFVMIVSFFGLILDLLGVVGGGENGRFSTPCPTPSSYY